MTIGSLDCGWGLPTLIRVLLLALKYMEVCLFLFPFCFGGVLKEASIVAASLANISGDFSFCCYFSMLLVDVPMSTVFVYIVAISGCVFPFCFCVSILAVTAFIWGFSAFSAFSFSWCLCCCFFLCFRLSNLALPPFSFYPCCAWMSCVPSPLVFLTSSMCSLSSLLDEVMSSAKILISSSQDMFQTISQDMGTM